MKPAGARAAQAGRRSIRASRRPRAARLATSPVAAMLLDLLVEELEPSHLVVSTYGIREGLLYSS
jgi:exopolyphosphatase/pppGpp-phosphohydrolase